MDKSVMNAIMNEDTLKMVSQLAGVDEKEAGSIVAAVLPTLLKGAASQNKNKDTAAGFLEAVLSHGEKDSSDMTKFIKNIDTEDGAKIVKHLLGAGGDEKAAEAVAAKAKGIDTKKIIKIMAILAPIIMNQLGKEAKKSGKKSNADMDGILGTLVENVDLGDVLKIAKILIK